MPRNWVNISNTTPWWRLAARLAHKLGIRRVVIPRSAGVGSALGFLWAPIAYQAIHSFYQRLVHCDLPAVNRLLTDLADQARRVVRGAAPLAPGRAAQGISPVGTRQVVVAADDQPVPYPVYERRQLTHGHFITGPALVTEDDTTTEVDPGFIVWQTASGHLILDANWSKNFRKGVPFSNASHYQNPEVDRLLTAAQSEIDPAKRVEEFREFQRIVARDAPDINLVSPQFITFYNRRVHDHSLTADGVEGNLSAVWVEGK